MGERCFTLHAGTDLINVKKVFNLSDYFYAHYVDTQITAKVPTQELSDATIKALMGQNNK